MKEKSKPKPKTVELVKSSYQPTKAEKEEEIQINATLDELGEAAVRPVNIRWIDKPRNRRK